MIENQVLQKSDSNVITFMSKVYMLLSVSFIPTIFTVYLLKDQQPNLAFSIVAFIFSIGIIFGLKATKNQAIGFILLMVFTALEGVILTPIIKQYLHGGQDILFLAFTMTFIVFVVMSFLSLFVKNVGFLDQFLFVGLILLIVASIVNVFFKIQLLTCVLSAIGVLIFSLFILYDTRVAIEMGKSGENNPIYIVLGLYLDLINLFINLLNLLSILTNRK